jgi:hypothetical protein
MPAVLSEGPEQAKSSTDFSSSFWEAGQLRAERDDWKRIAVGRASEITRMHARVRELESQSSQHVLA